MGFQTFTSLSVLILIVEGLIPDVSYQERLYEGTKSYALSFEYCARLVPK
jgi:hypothetical protein